MSSNSSTIQSAKKLLQTIFGYPDFRLNQEQIIQSLLAGRDALTLMPTGGGKSLCYQIPSLLLEGVGVVVSPLIALMQDQVEALHQLGIKAEYLNSMLSIDQTREIEAKLLTGNLDLLYVAPERLLSQSMLELLDRVQVCLFAIDEAHCVSQWGHDFRPEYQQLSILAQRYPEVPRIALTATADRRTRQEIIEQLNLQSADVYINSFDRPNIRYSINEQGNAKQSLWHFLSLHHLQDSGIVYCLSRKKTESIANWLADKGRVALPYHAGLSNSLRSQHQQRFLNEEGVIIVATIAFGMGVDKPDVRFVAHLNLPKSVEAYYQETGRAGRDGQPANAWMAYGLQDAIMLRQLMSGSNASDQQKRVEHHKLNAMLGLCEMISCRRHGILNYFDESAPASCNNCDNCIAPPQTWDATIAAQKALSCVYRTEQRFGVNYLIDVLLGKSNSRISKFGSNKLSTYGIGKEHTEIEWRSIFRQLIALGYLRVDFEYGALKLSDSAKPILRQQKQLNLRALRKLESKKKPISGSAIRLVDQPLWEAMRECRKKLARQQNVPPYVIFHDKVLLDLLSQRPETLDEMSSISGIGEHKLNKYGDIFIKILQQHPRNELLNNRLSNTVNETLALFSNGLDVLAISKARNLNISTIYQHLSEAIEKDLVDVLDVIDLEQNEYDYIIDAYELLDEDEKQRIKPLFQVLNEQYDYDVLRCVLASVAAD